MAILNRAEIAALNKGRRSTHKVKAHERVILTRAPQQLKDNCIYGFAIQFTNQLERYEVTVHDKRHVVNLITHLRKVAKL